MTDRKHSHYFRPFPYDNIDIYRFLEVFDVTCPVAQHIINKAVATGKRGHKDLQRDWQDIVDSAQRKLEMLRENDLAWFGCSEEELGEIALDNKTIPVQPKEVIPVTTIPNCFPLDQLIGPGSIPPTHGVDKCLFVPTSGTLDVMSNGAGKIGGVI